jgi:ABC-type phosphate transport system substrate-binding protein
MQYHQTHSQGAIKILGLKAGRDGQVYTPDKKYGVTGDYPLNRGLFLYYDKNAKDPLIKDFVEYCVAATQ